MLRFALSATDRTYARDSLAPGAPASFPFAHQLMPVLVLRQAILRSPTLRYLGRRSAPDGGEDIVSFNNADGSVLAVGFDRESGLLATVETIGEIGPFGDGTHVWRFREYRSLDGLRIPAAFQHRVNGLLQEDMRLESATVNPVWADGSFAVPEGYTLRSSPPRTGSAPSVVRAAARAWFIEGLGGYRAMFVDGGDGVVVVEAPVSARAAEQAIALIERTLPGKPITHVVLTHHHWDHIAGVRPYVQRGAAILVPPGMDGHLRRILDAPRMFGRLGESPAPKSVPRIEVVTGRLRLAGGVLELIDVGETSHAAGMLVAYLPLERLLFQGDLFQIGEGGAPSSPPTAQELIVLIDRHGLDVQTIGSVHGRTATMAELRSVAELDFPARSFR